MLRGPIGTRTAPERVAETIRERILSDEWPEESAIPKEVDLAKELDVSRMTLRAGIAMLVSEGLLEATAALGTYVKSWQRNGSMRVLEWLLLLHLGHNPKAVQALTRQTLWLRRAFYKSLCELLCRPGVDLKEARYWLHPLRMLYRKDGGIPNEVLQNEELILVMIAEATGNVPVALSANGLRRALEVLNRCTTVDTEIRDETDHFEALFDALAARKQGQAEACMEKVCQLRESLYLARGHARRNR